MSSPVTLPPDRNSVALRLDAGRGDALAAQVGAQRRFVRRERLAAHLVAALVLAFPEELGSFLRLPITAINQSLRSSSLPN
jgi:hypothetical protein